ncbi:MAG: hypothetical protein IKN57_12220, partial [Parasporobacterium sp.]|nr:hypothetical protein [Parasporobacterium sp.]
MGQNENRAFDAQICAFAPLKAQTLPDKAFFEYKPMDTGVRVNENGDVYLGYWAPEAKEVTACFGMAPRIPMEKGDDDIWRAILPFDKEFVGPKA